MRLLRFVALLSGVYDLLLGGALLFALDETVRVLGVPPPRFPINANLNGLFALAVGAGYLAILRAPERGRFYLWIMGPFLKGGGAVLFVLDFALRGSPPVFLLFAVSDGALAALTAFALTRRTGPAPPPAAGGAATRGAGEARDSGPAAADEEGTGAAALN